MARNQNPVRQEKEEERLKVYKKEKQIDRVVATAFQGRCNCFAPFANKGKCPCWNQTGQLITLLGSNHGYQFNQSLDKKIAEFAN